MTGSTELTQTALQMPAEVSAVIRDGVNAYSDMGTEFDSTFQHVRDTILSEKGKIAAATLAPVAKGLHSTKNALTLLKEDLHDTRALIEHLQKNPDVTKCLNSAKFKGDNMKLLFKAKASNYNSKQTLGQLINKTNEIETQINHIQKCLDTVAIGMIVFNVAMIYQNIHGYFKDSATLETYKRKLIGILDKIRRCSAWYRASAQTDRERTHFRLKVIEMSESVTRIETELKHLRNQNVEKGVLHVCTGLGTMAMSCFLPVSCNAIFWGMVASGAINAGTVVLNCNIVGRIDELLPIIVGINSQIRECRSIQVQDSDLPEFD